MPSSNSPAAKGSWKTRLLALLVASQLYFLIGGTAPAETESPSSPPRQVLLLHSFGMHFAPWNAISGSLREELVRQSPYPIELHEVALQGDRFGPIQDQSPFTQFLQTLFAEKKFDLVIAMGAPAARFVQQHRAPMFSSIPLLITGADERTFAPASLTTNDAVVAVTSDLAVQAENILQLLPDTTTIAVLLGGSPLEKFWADEYRRAFQPFAGRVSFKWMNDLSFDEIFEQVAHLPPNSAIYYGSLRVDAHGIPEEEDRMLSRLHQVASAPVFTYIDSNFGKGIVGGPMLSTQEVARRGAAAAIRILGGETPSEVRTPTLGTGAPIYDERELRRWNISESRLPAGSTVAFREPTFWEQYRWPIVATLAGLVLQAALIAGLLYERRRRRHAEIQSQQRLAELAHLNRYSTANELGSSIAHEINQPLGAIQLNSETAQILLSAQSPDLDEIRKIIADILRDDQRAGDVVRRLRSLLKGKPFESRNIDLNETISEVLELISITARERNVRVTRVLSAVPLRILGDSVQLQQVALNIIINGMDAISQTNGGPREITVRTALANNCAELTISDTGPGIPREIIRDIFNPFFTTKEDGMGMGLSIARTIVEAHDGLIQAENGPAGGAIFHIDLPLATTDAHYSERRDVRLSAAQLVQ
jgi:signal transduction histidine kinase